MNIETKTLWTRVDGKKPKREAVLIGQRISPDWLSSSVNLTQVRFAGEMKQAFSDLISAAKDKKLNLPVVSLRTALISQVDNVVSLDKNLGIVADNIGRYPCAIELYTPAEEDMPVVREALTQIVKRWIMDDVEIWAERNKLGHLLNRLTEAVIPSAIEFIPIQAPYIGDNQQPNYPLIARSIGDRLAGEILFDELDQNNYCELVASPEYRSNAVELMTLPRKGTGRDEVYSMVAKLTVVSVPYSKDIYLSVSAMKRVWAKKPPMALFNSVSSATAYVMAMGRPVTKVRVVKTLTGWEFGEEYASLWRESEEKLPRSLSEAIAQRDFNSEIGWWSGLPELPSLYRSVSPRTVFEGDEISLLHTISNLLHPIVNGKAIPIMEIKLPRFQAKPKQEMLKLSDFGVAGAVFDTEEDFDEDEEEDQDNSTREEKLECYRIQNMEALNRVHGETMPIVWALSDYQTELELVKKTVGVLFGDSIIVNTEPLPEKTHGLRIDLDQPKYTARKRFDERVKRWQAAADTIKKVSGERHIIVLICASDRVGNKPEDAVNYYAGIHAMSTIGANVHHVLPIENPDDPKSKQGFLHRLQSALLDVILAHTGVVFGVKEFIGRLLPVEQFPYAIYGVQAVRSRAQSRSGQTGVNFMLYSRIIVDNGTTEVRIGYRDGPRNQITDWMPLAKGLSWMGCQRRLQDGDSNWLKAAFTDLTRQALLNIAESDPKAIVLIEWESVRSLWRGISDVDLGSSNSPRLDSANLAQFTNMTFIRLRRGSDTLSLRTMVKTAFRGWKEVSGERVDTGDINLDTYVTTDMRLVQIAEESMSEDRRFGHYIASMGYAKTVQVKRGFSCYRAMPRMCRMGKGLNEFEQKILDVASMDASLPAPMDVSVMSSPQGVNPKQYAILAMGLRLGYAHYNDWTALPMPLFFRRKIEDYAIRYPEDIDDGEIGDTASGEVLEENVGSTNYSKLVVQEAEGILEEMPIQDETASDVNDTLLQEDSDDLLRRVKRTTMPVIMSHRDDYQSRRLYQRMLNGDADVLVELPYWVRLRGIFTIMGAVTKRRVQRSWDRMKDFGYVKSGVSMPRVDCYIDWLAEKLRIPQVCATVIMATREIGQISFAPMVDLIERDFNSDHPKEEQVNPFAIEDEMLVRMAKWADSHRHDELMGWLVFMESQLPNPKRLSLVIENINTIPGPRTEHALEYYLATASAINIALDQKHQRGHIDVRLNLPKPKLEEPPTPFPQDHKESFHQNTSNVKEIPLAKLKATTRQEQEFDLTMTTKKTLIQLIEEIEPGSNNFDETLTQIQAQIAALSEIHTEKKLLYATAVAMADKMNSFIEHQMAVAERINGMRELLEIGQVSLLEVHSQDLDAAIDELSKIEEVIATLSALLTQLDELERSPVPFNLQERKKRKDIEQQIAENAYSRAESVRSLLQDSLCFDIEALGNPPTEENVECDTSAKTTFDATAQSTPEIATMPDDDNPILELVASDPLQPINLDVLSSPQLEVLPYSVTGTVDSDLPISEAKTNEPATFEIHSSPEPEKVIPIAADFTDTEPSDPNDMTESLVTESSMGATALESEIDTLNILVSRRLYGLADVHVTTIGNMIGGTDDQELQVHHAILTSLIQTLSSMDCRFSFDGKINSKLNELLVSEKLPSGDISDPAHTALGILAASIGNMLFDTSDVQWRIGNAVSARLVDYSALSDLVEHLDLIRRRGFVLTRDLFVRSRIGAKNAIEHELARFQTRAESWKQAPEIHSTFNHRGFMSLHEEMFSPSNPIGKCLAYIGKGDVAKVTSAYEEAKRKFEKPAQTVDELYKKVGEKSKPDGLYRVRAIENIEITEKFVESYLYHVRQRNSQSAELTRDVQAFLDGLNNKLIAAVKETRQIKNRTHLEALYQNAAIKALECVMLLFDTREPAAYIPDNKQKFLIQLPIGKDLMPAMSPPDKVTPPLCTYDNVFEQTRRLAEENLTLGDPSSDDDIDKVLVDAYQGHITAKRFLPAFLIESTLPKPLLPKVPTLQQYAIERHALIAELQEARQKVAHAMTLSALPQQETNRMQWLIEELLMLCCSERSIGMPDVESAIYPDFPQARAALRSNVLQPLERRLSDAKNRLEIELEEEERKGVLPITDIVRIKNMLESSNAATLRTAHDALAMLRHSGKLPARMLSSNNIADEYDVFMESLKKAVGHKKNFLEALKGLLNADPSPEVDPDWLASLDFDQRSESAELINAWLEFFTTRNPMTKPELTERLFRAMGITIPPTPCPETARLTRARFILDDKTFLFTTTADDPMFIPPALGSWSSNTQCYALFGVTQENDIRQLLQEIGSSPTIVLARTHLSMQKRAKVSGNSPVVLVDDNLIAYAALHPSERLQILIKIGILTFTTNPYDDYNTKPVPTEMFFGRQEELTRLRGVKGLAVLYGGRRLGKSSLLSQIEQESRNSPGQEAVYVSMDTVDTAGEYVMSAWEFIYRALLNRKLIQSIGITPKHWKPILQHIEKELIESSKLKSLFLLIDEADNLMGCELRRKSNEDSFVRSLIQLTDNVKDTCNVRMVIAGLHNMTRMANDENSVFGKAEPIALKPFSSADDVQRGIRLITKPLAAMGYIFGQGAEDLPLRILSVCNFYPAFVQLYCKRLVERLQNNRQDKRPPIEISDEDLNAVEKDNNLLSELREKFKLNLNLDKRYKAIALILADVYYTEIESGQYNGLTTSEIREYCEVYCGRHFENTGPGVFEALLDEMSKLNVVEKNGTRYVLRNPNIAMMVGDRDRVTTLISELASEPPEISRSQGERRIVMTKNNSYSQMIFPMPMSWIRNHMDGSDGELLILTGNALSGIMDLARVERDEWQLQDGFFVSVPGNSPQNLADAVAKNRRITQENRSQKIMSVRNAAWRVDQIPEYAAIANKASKYGIRIILLAHPERALEITAALESGKLTPPSPDVECSWRVVPIPPWSDDAIYYRVHENIQVAENQEGITAIRMATCGFGKEVNDLCSDLTLEKALKAPENRRKVLAPNLNSFYQHIGIPPSLIAERGDSIKDFLDLMNGVNRSNIAELQEIMMEFSITEDMFQFLYWMGLIQEGAEHTWTVPKLYADL
ncbi:RNaseH domain-containing protein [Methylomonas sp. OY6]|uniref:RNaseH domain-containing protein n=1 Tax=Methylomonas defluvii TaxID=3045149 RepID=A0ABU4UAT0_9GAMM|nr:RNaseH domain-containing protein [Methylomonas sp. OY6]MDX8126444.1 RNaseH domain-containing protein [Methylomonas sp. OY6]